MARVLLTLDEPLGRADGRLAGLAVRVHEMANALARAGHAVTVAAPAGDGPTPDAGYRLGALDALAAAGPIDVWISHPRMVARCAPALAGASLVVDGYESPFGSYLAHAAALLPTQGDRVVYEYRATVVELLAALGRADHVLCATESQRISYCTLLAAMGRIGPRTPEPDLVLRVCSGAPPPPAAPAAPPAPPVLLWAGGCYPWFDVETPLAALPRIVEAVPEVRVVLAGLGGIDEERSALPPKARRVREAIAADSRLRARATFVPWQAYRARADLYRGATVGLCSYDAHLETQLAMRTRVIDMIWGGLPVVVSAGDEVGGMVASAGAGLVVPPGDAAALAEATAGVLGDPARRTAMAERARALAAGPLSWDRQIAPLDRYCRAVAAGEVRVRPAVPEAEAILRPNDGVVRRGGDALRALWGRLARASRRLGALAPAGAGGRT